MKVLHMLKTLHTSIAIICLLIIALFVYEKNVITFTDYADIYAVIPSAIEFEGDEPIGFFLFMDNTDETTVSVRQILMCDYADNHGFGVVSSQITSLELTAKSQVLAKTGRNIENIEANQSNVSAQLRELLSEGDVADFLRYDQIPRETAQCFTKFRFTKFTPNFHIEKSFDTVSFPFDYIWYYQPTSNARSVYTEEVE